MAIITTLVGLGVLDVYKRQMRFLQSGHRSGHGLGDFTRGHTEYALSLIHI